MIPSSTPPCERRRPLLGGARATPRLARLLLLLVLLGTPAAAQDPSAESVAEEAAEAPEEEAAEPPEEATGAPGEAASVGQAQVELDAAQLDEALDSAAPLASDDMEEILVTGIRREDLLQDIPISITSFNAAEIKSLRIQNIQDLAEYTPNLEINTAFAASNPTLFIRGIGLKDYNANAAGAVAVYQDGININSPAIQLGQIFDTRSIEVLKGPQGSLNGRNATAGAIMINSVLPDGQFGFNSSFTYGNYNTIEAEAAMTIPIVEDMLSARVAFTANFRDGVTKNNCSKWDPTTLKDENGNPLPKLTEETTTNLYNDLQPFAGGTEQGGRVLILEDGAPKDDASPGVPPEDQTDLQRRLNLGFERTELRYVYLNGELASEVRADEATRDDVGRLFNPLTLPDGSVLPAGTVVGLQDKLFGFSPSKVDGVCIIDTPGNLLTYEGADLFQSTQGKPFPFAGPATDPRLLDDSPTNGTLNEFTATPSVTSLDELQGLKRYINNVDNWAGRGILRLQPTEGMDWILNFHGGQNRSDSAHLQSIGAKSEAEFIVEAVDGNTNLANLWPCHGIVRVIAALSGKIEGDGQARLTTV